MHATELGEDSGLSGPLHPTAAAGIEARDYCPTLSTIVASHGNRELLATG